MLLVLRLLLLAPLLGLVEGDAADCPETRYIADECRDGTKSEPPALSLKQEVKTMAHQELDAIIQYKMNQLKQTNCHLHRL